MIDGYHMLPTMDHFLHLIEKRKPGLTADQQTLVANTAMNIYNSHVNSRWMRPMMAVKMALFQLGF